jgi:hypothetical protein
VVSRKAGLWYLLASGRGRGLRVCLPAGTDMAVEVSRGGVKELSKWCKENIGGSQRRRRVLE